MLPTPASLRRGRPVTSASISAMTSRSLSVASRTMKVSAMVTPGSGCSGAAGPPLRADQLRPALAHALVLVLGDRDALDGALQEPLVGAGLSQRVKPSQLHARPLACKQQVARNGR